MTSPRRKTCATILAEVTPTALSRPDLTIEGRGGGRQGRKLFFAAPAVGCLLIWGTRGLFHGPVAVVSAAFLFTLFFAGVVASAGFWTIPRPVVEFRPSTLVVANTYGRRREIRYTDLKRIGVPYRGWQRIALVGGWFARVAVPLSVLDAEERKLWQHELAIRAPWLVPGGPGR